ncbi:GW dipeptide domain-containing protein [Carnobacterium iners]|uniref:GW dipeptide domain-containing protein n=2 Tax=Carnobacterium iners TaxID=1073423 RepID=UPI00135652EB|nr:GW dipeptide domain-containing protein [Carnobacterium iners]
MSKNFFGKVIILAMVGTLVGPSFLSTTVSAVENNNIETSVSTYNLNATPISKKTAFINATSAYATSVANEYGIYPSVMLAQAALESDWGTSMLAYNPNFNYFGIKGSYNNNFFTKYTREYSEKDGWTIIKANFKKYLSVNSAFIDYADKLTKGPGWDNENGSWDKNFYSGTWRINADTYKDATKSLLNKYATDPNYNTKLDAIIETYNLTRFDKMTSIDLNTINLEASLAGINYDEVISTTDVKDYSMHINSQSEGIYTAPKDTENSKILSTTMEYLNRKVFVKEEKKTKNGSTWAYITLDGKELGWIDIKGLTSFDVTLSEKNINYTAKITRKTDGINTLPYGLEGSKLVVMSSGYYGKDVTITKEMVTTRATWSYIKDLGWIDKKGLDIEKITAVEDTSYYKRIGRKTDGINTQPWGTEGFALNYLSSNFFGKQVKVIKEATTRRSTWAYITLDGKELGWIDIKGLTSSDVTLSEKNIDYTAKITRKTDGINTLPYGLEGSLLVSMSSGYYGKDVTITKEMVTTRATWSYIKDLGWIDKKGLDIEKITAVKDTSYYKRIGRKTDGINTQPWGTEGFALNYLSSNFFGKQVKVIKEATTRRSTWAYITLDGKELGWIDIKGLTSSDVTLSEKNIDYTAKITRKTDGINTLPYGLEGSLLVSMSSGYYGKDVTITKEMVTTRATWSYIKDLGWIDKKGLDIEKITAVKDTSYYKRIGRKTDGINTQPWGTEGFALNYLSSNFFGKQVKVIKEATTRRSTWAYITLDGKELGWIDIKGLTSSDVTLSEKNIDYTAKITRKTDGINTLPYGLEGSLLVSMSSGYYGKDVTITKEMVTTRATWSYIKDLGWIDKKGLDIEKITAVKDTSYYKRIGRKTDGINTQPWGTEGFALNYLSSNFFGKQVKVIKEATTRRSTWAYITLDGKELGWIDIKGLTSSDVTLSEKNINYTAKITRKTDGINTLPYGLEGSLLVSMSSDYYGENITVAKEMVTTRATWALIYFEGKNLGWVDKRGLNRIDLFKNVVVLDPGHGGTDPGARAGGINEKDLNLTVAKKVELKLEQAGYEVVMTRSTDKFLELSERAATANRANPDIFVSIHTNSFNTLVYGIETFSYNKNGDPNNILKANDPSRLLNSSLLSQNIQNSLISNTNAFNRGAKKANFHVVRETWMPAVLVEIGFVDNTTERNKLVTNTYQEKIATGIVGGIQTYFKNIN